MDVKPTQKQKIQRRIDEFQEWLFPSKFGLNKNNVILELIKVLFPVIQVHLSCLKSGLKYYRRNQYFEKKSFIAHSNMYDYFILKF